MKKLLRYPILSLAILNLFCLAESANDEKKTNPLSNSEKKEIVESILKDLENPKLKSLGFGYGLAIIQNISGRKAVENAYVDNDGVLIVENKSNTRLGFILETHYLFNENAVRQVVDIANDYDKEISKLKDKKRTTIPKNISDELRTYVTETDLLWGPYVSAELGGDEIINSLGGGMMFSFRKIKIDENLIPKTDDLFNLALGIQIESNQKVLPKDIIEGQRVGQGFQPRFESGSRIGIIFMFSKNF